MLVAVVRRADEKINGRYTMLTRPGKLQPITHGQITQLQVYTNEITQQGNNNTVFSEIPKTELCVLALTTNIVLNMH